LLNSPWDVTYLDDKLYIAMAGLHQLWALDTQTGVAQAVAGTGREDILDGEARKSALAQPSGLATDGKVLYFTDAETSAIRRYDPRSGHIETLAGHGLFIFGDLDGAREDALLQHPLGVAAYGDVLYVADTYNHKIRRFDLKHDTVATLAGVGHPGRAEGDRLALYEPGGLAIWNRDLFIADTNNDRIIHYRLDTGRWREIILTLYGKPLAEAA
jgi:sugar lactone lactonase YvrE